MKRLFFLVLPVLLLTGCAYVTTPGTTFFTSPEIRTLDYSGQKLNSVPSDVFDKIYIENLNLSNNNLTGAIPGEIRHLQELKILDLSNNKMTGLPAEIGQLKKLEVLNLSNNQLTGLPYELGGLSNLKILDLSGNPYSELDLQIISKTLLNTGIVTK